MSDFIEHSDLKARLDLHLPPVTLIYHPKDVSFWEFSKGVLRSQGIEAQDLFLAPFLDTVRNSELKKFLALNPAGIRQGVLLNLDAMQNIFVDTHLSNLQSLLKLLESSPQTLFILLASTPTLSTIESRAALFRVGYPRNFRESRQEDEHEKYIMGSVEALIKAIDHRDKILFEASLAGWRRREDGVAGLNLFFCWLREAITQRWVKFEPENAVRLVSSPDILKAMLVDLSSLAEAPPKIAAQAALDKYLGI